MKTRNNNPNITLHIYNPIFIENSENFSAGSNTSHLSVKKEIIQNETTQDVMWTTAVKLIKSNWKTIAVASTAASAKVVEWIINNVDNLIHGSQQLQYHHNDIFNSIHFIAAHFYNFHGLVI